MAPGRLALVQSFVNSVNVEFGPDEFADTDLFAGWLRRHELIHERVPVDDLDRRDAIALREALRAMLRENNGKPPDLAARRTVEHVARDCPLVVSFGGADDRLRLRPARSDVRGAFGTVLAHVADAVVDGSWERLKACSEHRCEWAFYDRSRNRRSRWCSMVVCGTRAKMHTYRHGARTQH